MKYKPSKQKKGVYTYLLLVVVVFLVCYGDAMQIIILEAGIPSGFSK